MTKQIHTPHQDITMQLKSSKANTPHEPTCPIKRLPFIAAHLLKKIKKHLDQNLRTPITTYSRASMITPDCIGLTFAVHNGKKFVPVQVTEAKVGFKFGEFAPTRLFRAHSGTKKTIKPGAKK